jgi:type IV pilus assembly protein PilM
MALRKRVLLPIGIHLNLESVHMAQVEQADGSLTLVSKASMVFPPLEGGAGDANGRWTETAKIPPEVKENRYRQARDFVRQRCSADGFRGNQAVINVPAEQLIIQQVRMAPMQPEELMSALPWELQGKLPFDPKQAVVRHIVAGTVSEDNQTKQDVIALAVPRDAVEKHIRAVEKLGLEVVGVGVEPCAMCYPYIFAASHAAASPEGPGSLVLVHIGALATYVAIARGEETRFVKGVTLGVESVVQALADARKTSVEQARATMSGWCAGTGSGGSISAEAVEVYNQIRKPLGHFVDEIESCIRYYSSLARGAGIDRIVFLGPGARDRALVQVIGSHLSVPCEVGAPLRAASQAEADGEAGPELAVALGLSLFGAQ